MSIKNMFKFEFAAGEKLYHFLCENDAPLQDAKNALCDFMKKLGQIEDNIKMQSQVAPPQTETPVPEPVAESSESKIESIPTE